MFTIGIENVQLYHNRGTSIGTAQIESIQAFFDPWRRITKGTLPQQRIGDEIYPRGMQLKLWISNKTDRENTKVRVIVALLPKTTQGLLGVNVTSESFDPFEQSQQFGDVNNILCLNADKDRGVKFLYDKIHYPGATQVNNTAGKEKSKVLKLWIKRKNANKIIYDQDYAYISNKPIAVYVIPYEQYNTLQTDNVASIAGQMRLYYKDP